MALAITHGQLGNEHAAHEALQKLLQLRPDFAVTARPNFERWWDAAYVEHLIDGLRKAGLDVATAPGSP